MEAANVASGGKPSATQKIFFQADSEEGLREKAQRRGENAKGGVRP